MDRNVFNLSVAVLFDATNAQLTDIENLISAGSAVIFDVTDGQAEIGEAFIHNNAFGTDADVRVYDATCTSGTNVGNACAVHNDCPPNPPNADPGECGVWWQALTGSWGKVGSIKVSINWIYTQLDVPHPDRAFAHEFTHLVFDAKDEYESRAVNCGAWLGWADCPDAAAGQEPSLMDGDGTEYCWGHGDPTNLTDMSGGNHDATDVTEQSRCRSNRSVWDQVVWAWPSTFIKPAGAPDPAANGATVNATKFVRTDNTTRVVLVLDESGSMALESPSRMERLKVAANDFVTLAESGTELGIVSYSNDAEATSGRQNVAIAALGANRSNWTNAINAMSPNLRTNIGAGLQKAKDMINAAGGVTANT
ncbi:MAG: VWA domain-containing protein, partial [Gemmatimonadota bacterium]